MDIKEQIRTQREKSGLSQRKVSTELGYTYDVMHLIENGRIKLTIELLNKLHELYDWEFEIKIKKS